MEPFKLTVRKVLDIYFSTGAFGQRHLVYMTVVRHLLLVYQVSSRSRDISISIALYACSVAVSSPVDLPASSCGDRLRLCDPVCRVGACEDPRIDSLCLLEVLVGRAGELDGVPMLCLTGRDALDARVMSKRAGQLLPVDIGSSCPSQ